MSNQSLFNAQPLTTATKMFHDRIGKMLQTHWQTTHYTLKHPLLNANLSADKPMARQH